MSSEMVNGSPAGRGEHFNPVRFGRQVIGQFGRYLRTAFPIADARIDEQLGRELSAVNKGQRLTAKGPYVYLNRPFEPGPTMPELIADSELGLHSALAGIFRFDGVFKHQELTLRAIKAGRHTIVSTGTGSGKTEAFLLPVIDHALHLRDEDAPTGITTVIVYPMNALADDQLRRLRPILAGTGVTFGRYTGLTPDKEDAAKRLPNSRKYTADELKLLEQGKDEDVPLPWEECVSREEIRARRPRILLTNYQQLEYLLLRDQDLELFRDAPLKHLVFDEVHTYTGVLGSEVAALIRRLREVADKTADDVLCVGTSATVADSRDGVDGGEAVTRFASRLFGVPKDQVELVREQYVDIQADGELFMPAMPKVPQAILNGIMETSEALPDHPGEGEDLPEYILGGVYQLCGRTPPPGLSVEARVADLLSHNAYLLELQKIFSQPTLIDDAIGHLRQFDRQDAPEEDLVAEVLAYLFLGAMVRKDGEPLLRPKLHYFVQGLQGIKVSFDDKREPHVHFDSAPDHEEEQDAHFQLHACRTCGQHYYPVLLSEEEHSSGQGGYFETLLNVEEHANFQPAHLLEKLHTENEDSKPLDQVFVCRACGTVHTKDSGTCNNLRCGKQNTLMPMYVHRGELTSCLACGTSPRKGVPVAVPLSSTDVWDVTILAQSMLSAVTDERLQKLLVFADSRQDAAFQAGWMEERARRFRLRYLLFDELGKNPVRVWGLQSLAERIVERAVEQRVLQDAAWDPKDNVGRVMWFLLEEFASRHQRRNSLESLGLARVHYKGLQESDPFFEAWGKNFGIPAEAVRDLLGTLLDHFRRQGIVSHEQLKRFWNGNDLEVRKGIISLHRNQDYRPLALLRAKTGDDSAYTKIWTSTNGRAAAQVITKQAVDGASDDADAFLSAAWDWLREKELLVPVDLVRKWAGRPQKIQVPGVAFQINYDRVGVQHADGRYVCNTCHKAQQARTPNGKCPEYNCKGTLEHAPVDQENYYVAQYADGFTPLKPREHSAQVPKDERVTIEREFKRDTSGLYNCLVATPTLEMGVDIGKLELVLMRNVPPTPANYAQRSGRAGRRHRIAVVMTFCRGTPHDRYFFDRPEEMIGGIVRVPAFSMRNTPLIKKHVHSIVLTHLRQVASDSEKNAITAAFPAYVRDYFSKLERKPADNKQHAVHMEKPLDVTPFVEVIASRRDELLDVLKRTLQASWPDDAEDREAVSDDALAQHLDSMGKQLQEEINYLHQQIAAYRHERSKLREIEGQRELDSEEKESVRRYDSAISALLSKDQDNYALTYLANAGFFPGYAMHREGITATALDPYLPLARPVNLALRELSPASRVYANRNVFKIQRLRFRRAHAGDSAPTSRLAETFAYYPDERRITPKNGATHVGGAHPGVELQSFPLIDVELRQIQRIDDQDEYRYNRAQTILGMLLEGHAGGHHGSIGNITYDLHDGQHLRLVNLGLSKTLTTEQQGFPLCSVCGETRHPLISAAELESFTKRHKDTCGADIHYVALHADLISDTLKLGPFPDRAEAINVAEALRIGASHVLDMGDNELELIDVSESDDRAFVALYDPMPGGSGFLPLILEYWQPIVHAAIEALDGCPSGCSKACYSCLLTYRNQQHHAALDRHLAVALLKRLDCVPRQLHSVQPVVLQKPAPANVTDSDAELDFQAICLKRGVPAPSAAQYKVETTPGHFTVADWAYPEAEVLVYVDGMSEAIHGNPAQRVKDRRQRMLIQQRGYKVHVITAEELRDEEALAIFLEDLQRDVAGPKT